MTPDHFQDLLIQHLSKDNKWEHQVAQLLKITAPDLLSMQEALSDHGHDLYRGMLLTQNITVREAENFYSDFKEAFMAAKRGWQA